MKSQSLLIVVALVLSLVGCNEEADASGAGSVSNTGSNAEVQADTVAPACETVVNNIASLNPGSGESERTLWNKMCDELTDSEKGCVVEAKDMESMKGCLASRGKLSRN